MIGELTLFAGLGFAVFAADELVIDTLWVARATWRHFFVFAVRQPATVQSLVPTSAPGRMAIFVPAWDESEVIGAMLAWANRAYAGQQHDIFVGCYPNDPATISIVKQLNSATVHAVICGKPGPTTKADCLNQIWEVACGDLRPAGRCYKGIVLHDAEDVVSAMELPIFDTLLDKFDLIQLPVIPMVDRDSRFVSGHYCDEFAEAHGKTLIVREMLGAAIPSAGVGCALRTDMVDRLAIENGGKPFKIDSLTEDYELGLHIRSLGGSTVFVRLPGGGDEGMVGTRAHFPATIEASVRQKARWIVGISLAGWDRLGWSGGWGEHWMRWRDRRALLAALLLATGYLAVLLVTLAMLMRLWSGGRGFVMSPFLVGLLYFNAAALVWRCLVRGFFVHKVYGWREAFLSVVRLPVANIIMMIAARRALFRYWTMLRNGKVEWDKTAHKFPTEIMREP